MVIKPEPGQTFCTTWDVTDHRGEPISVGFVARAVLESQDDGSERLICRAMNWRSEREGPAIAPDHLAQRILDGLAQPGVHRALVDLNNWTLLKWLDDPCPFYDWRASRGGRSRRSSRRYGPHGCDDGRVLRRADLAGVAVAGERRGLHAGPCDDQSGRARGGHIAGLVSLRLPTEAELATAAFADLAEADEAAPTKSTRKHKRRKAKA